MQLLYCGQVGSAPSGTQCQTHKWTQAPVSHGRSGDVPDARNKSDVVGLIETLPDYLEEYQMIISMAKSETSLVERLKESDIPMEEFEKEVEESDEDQTMEFGNEDRGVA